MVLSIRPEIIEVNSFMNENAPEHAWGMSNCGARRNGIYS